ncbi:MAG: hypothetical protein M3O84_05925 [Actinomycetota bacterium]|nr:hypothetical protein [Actinomycetota bacterium]
MKRAVLAGLTVLLAVGVLSPAAAAGPGGHPSLPGLRVRVIHPGLGASAPTIPSGSVSESARSDDHQIRCRVVFPSDTLQPGFESGARMTVENVTDHPVTISRWFLNASLIFRDARGDVLSDTGSWPFPGPAPVPQKLGAGERVKLGVRDAVIRWDDSISIQPVCSVGHRVHLQPIRFEVDVPSSRPSPPRALASALRQTGGLFDSCTPDANGDKTIGSIAPPLGTRPAMDAKCWAKIVAHPGFDVVDISFLTPSDLHGKELPVGPSFTQPPGNKRSAEQVRYGFVVSSLGVAPYDSMEVSRTRPGPQKSFDFFLHNGRWKAEGWSRCGGEAFGWGRGVFLEVISSCPA